MIYFIQDSKTHAIKIGYSAAGGESRKAALQTGNASQLVLLAEIPGDRAAEADLHDRFHEDRLCGEWFRPSPAVIRHIASVASADRGADDDLYELADPGCSSAGWPVHFYFAGKVGVREYGEWLGDWRKSILGAEPTISCHEADELAGSPAHSVYTDIRPHTYWGPYYVASSSGDTHCLPPVREGDHGNDRTGLCGNASHRGYAGARVLRRSLAGIIACNVLFAWVDCLSCYGTLAEIGFARAIRRDVWIASPHQMRDLWFVYEMANRTAFGPLPKCFAELLERHEASCRHRGVEVLP